MIYFTGLYIKKNNLRAVAFFLIILFNFFNSNLFAQAACTLPVDGPFYEYDTGSMNLDTLKNKGLCNTLPPGTGTQTVCYRYTYPSAGNVSMKYAVQYSSGGCNNNTCIVSMTSSYNSGGCNSVTACGGAVTIKTYDNNCGFIMNNAGVGAGCPSGSFVPGQDYIVCFEVPLHATCATTVCPIIGCSSGSCGCPPTITATAGTDQVLCGVTSTTLTGNSASPGTGTWTTFSGPNVPTITSPNSASTSVTGLIAGTYTFRWTASCGTKSGFDDVIVTVSDNLVPTISSNVPVTCTGSSTGSLTVTATGGSTPYTYAWSPVGGGGATASNLSAGTYTVTVSGGGCTQTTSATVLTSTALLAVTIPSTTNMPVTCTGSSTGSLTASVTGGTGPYTYAWTPVGGTNPIAGNLSAGTYTVTVTDAYNCVKTASATVTESTALLTVTIPNSSNIPVTCTGSSTGSLTASVTGGTGPYGYSWMPIGGTNPTAGNLSAGTYTVTVTDGYGCVKTDSAIVTESTALLTVTIPNSTNIPVTCTGSSTGSLTASVTGGTSPYTYAWTPVGGTNPIAGNLSAGTYTVTVTDAYGCVKTDSAIVTESTALLTVTIPNSTNIPVTCTGSSTGSLTASVTGGTASYTYAWTPVGGTGPTASGLSGGTYTITVTDGYGCIKTASATVLESTALLTVTVPGNTPVTCAGSTATVTITATGGTSPYVYSWLPSGGTGPTASGLSGGTYTVTVTDAYGCVKTATHTISITPMDDPSFTYSGGTFCQTGTDPSPVITGLSGGTFTANPVTLVIDPATGLIDLSASPLGGYTVTYTTNGPCPDSTTATVSITVAPSATFTYAGPYCEAGINPFPTFTGGGSGGVFTSTSGLVITPGTGEIDLTSSTPGTYVVTNTIAASGGCAVAIDSATVTINPSPTVNAGTNQTICEGDSVTIGSATIAGNTYSWTSSPAGFTSTSSDPTVSPVVTTVYTLTQLITATGCTKTGAVTITVNPAPTGQTATATRTTICEGDSTTISITSPVSGVTYTVYTTLTGGTPIGVAPLTVSPVITTTYYVEAVSTSACKQVTVRDSIKITVNPAPTAPTVSATNMIICEGDSSLIDVTNPVSGITYNVYTTLTGGNPIGVTPLTVSPVITTIYYVEAVSANNCKQLTARDSVKITVNPAPTGPTVSATATEICFGTSSTISVVSPVTGVTYNVYTTPTGGNPTGVAPLMVSPVIPTTYYIEAVSTNGCKQLTARDSITIIVNPLPVADTTLVEVTPANCGNNTGSITGIVFTSGTNPLLFTWKDASNNTVGTSLDLINVGPGIYTLTVTDSKGCSSSNPVGPFTIGSTNGVIASFTADPVTGERPLVVNFTNTSIGAINYTWDFGTGDISQVGNPAYTFTKEGIFTVCLIADDGNVCADTTCSTIDVYIISRFLLPNVFTPNGDGINDIFKVKSIGLETLDGEIYDRWGLKLYEWHTIDGGWDGRSATGELVPDGVYFYIISATGLDGQKYPGNGEKAKGAFTLIR